MAAPEASSTSAYAQRPPRPVLTGRLGRGNTPRRWTRGPGGCARRAPTRPTGRRVVLGAGEGSSSDLQTPVQTWRSATLAS